MKEITKRVLAGDVGAASLLIRWLEDGDAEANTVLKELYPHSGHAYTIGVTGAPGVGKSTLTDRLIRHIRGLGSTVGVLAVDPTSPFSGGAVLGDRIRMQDHALDDGVFIRSLATRGNFGGLARATRGARMILDALGKDYVIIETVGVGQDEVDIGRVADTTMMVLMPGLGDEVQSIKAGIMEVAEIFVVNKADKEGVERTIQELQLMLHMGKLTRSATTAAWEPPIVKTTATRNQGLDDLWGAIERHRSYLSSEKDQQQKDIEWKKGKQELLDLVKQDFMDLIQLHVEGTKEFHEIIDRFVSRESDPFTLSEQLMDLFWNKMNRINNP